MTLIRDAFAHLHPTTSSPEPSGIDEGDAVRAARMTQQTQAHVITRVAARLADAGELAPRTAAALGNTLQVLALPLVAADHFENDVQVAETTSVRVASAALKAGADAIAGTVDGAVTVGAALVSDAIGIVSPGSRLATGVDIGVDAFSPAAWVRGGAAALIDTGAVVAEAALAADEGWDGALAAASRAADRVELAAEAGDYGVGGRLIGWVEDGLRPSH
jgi:hypothetical protein